MSDVNHAELTYIGTHWEPRCRPALPRPKKGAEGRLLPAGFKVGAVRTVQARPMTAAEVIASVRSQLEMPAFTDDDIVGFLKVRP